MAELTRLLPPEHLITGEPVARMLPCGVLAPPKGVIRLRSSSGYLEQWELTLHIWHTQAAWLEGLSQLVRKSFENWRTSLAPGVELLGFWLVRTSGREVRVDCWQKTLHFTAIVSHVVAEVSR